MGFDVCGFGVWLGDNLVGGWFWVVECGVWGEVIGVVDMLILLWCFDEWEWEWGWLCEVVVGECLVEVFIV